MYGIYSKNRLKVYRDDKYSKDLIACCATESEAQEMVLSLTEEFVYHQFLQELQNFPNMTIELAVWAFQHAPKYGWDKFYYERIPMYEC